MLSTGEKPFPCTECDYRSYQMYKAGHIVYMTDYKNYIVCKCSYCEHERNSLYGSLHTEKKPFSWSECEYRSYHMYKLGNIGEKLFVYLYLFCEIVFLFCEIVSKVLIEVFHTGKKPHQCSECDYRFYQLRERDQTVGIYSFCEKESYSNQDGQCDFQIMLYTGDNLFICPECENFVSERDIEHLDTQHGAVKCNKLQL